MANDFDQFPLYDPLVKEDGEHMSNVWVGAMSTFFENLVEYLSQFGMFIPQVTTAQRDSIQSPQEGQLIYNTDAITSPSRTGQLQVYQVKAGVPGWHVITTT